MRIIAAIGAILACKVALAGGFSGLQHSYYRDGRRFDFALTCEQVRATARWTTEEPSPALSPRDARNLAEAEVARLFPLEPWRLSSIALNPVCADDYWYYAVAFSHAAAGFSVGEQLTIPVLMDGTTAPPAISPWPR